MTEKITILASENAQSVLSVQLANVNSVATANGCVVEILTSKLTNLAILADMSFKLPMANVLHNLRDAALVKNIMPEVGGRPKPHKEPFGF